LTTELSSGAPHFRAIASRLSVPFGFGGAELKKDFPNFACREFDRGHCVGECRIERTKRPWVIQVGIGSKANVKRLASDKGVQEDEPALF